jgi:transposase
LLQLDQASAHATTEVEWPENVVPIFQPSHSPELNPVERLWQELRKRFQGNNFATLSQLQQALFDELNALNPLTVSSLTGYPFILDALKI